MQITDTPADELKLAPYNPRKISKTELAKLRRSIKELGWLEPIVANKRSGNVVGGHQRLIAARLEQMETVPVIWVDMDERTEMASNLALNRISGEWDELKLGDVMEELASFGDDLALELSGFDEGEYQKRMESKGPSEPKACPNCGWTKEVTG